MSEYFARNHRAVDAEVQAAVVQVLKSSQRSSLSGIRVSVRRQTVTLRGYLPTYYDRHIAVDAVRSVSGVLRIFDETKVARDLPLRDAVSFDHGNSFQSLAAAV